MRVDDFPVTVDGLHEEIFDANPRHFDNRALRLERGLYVIRERTNDKVTKVEPPVDECARLTDIYNH
ncbi:MAG: hypothetical protein AB1757_08300 [Acidobacteriota bacterium]